jgi:hypothetical protein
MAFSEHLWVLCLVLCSGDSAVGKVGTVLAMRTVQPTEGRHMRERRGKPTVYSDGRDADK